MSFKKIILQYLLLNLLLIKPIFAAYPNVIKDMPSDTHWIFQHSNACLMPDNIHRISAAGECLALQTYYGNNSPPLAHPKLLIFIHGDGLAGGSPSDYLKFQATKFINSSTVSVVMIRPGYYDSYNNYSTGESYAFAWHGYPGDAFRPQTVETIASSIQNLKNYYHPSCTIVIGHSGGAMMSGVLLGKYPNLVNGAVLASVTNNVHEWTQKHGWGTWPNSMSPNQWVNQIPKNNFIYIISGNKDNNTYPEMAKQYWLSLTKAKINAHFISVPNGDHNSIVLDEAKEFNDAIKSAIRDCDNPSTS